MKSLLAALKNALATLARSFGISTPDQSKLRDDKRKTHYRS
jgi:hypothetical protein